MKFLKSALSYVILAASTVAAIDEQIPDNTKAAKSLRGNDKGTGRQRGLKGSKSGEGGGRGGYGGYDPWRPDPPAWHDPPAWKPDPPAWHYPEVEQPWYPEGDDHYGDDDAWHPDPWYPSDDYVSSGDPEAWNPDPWTPDPWAPEPWEPEPWTHVKKPKLKKFLAYKKAKGAKGSKSSKGKGGGHGGDYHPWDPEPVPPHHHPKECKHFKIKLGAIQAPAQATVPTDGGASLGAEFIYNSPLFEDASLTTPVGDPNEPDAFVTGVCTRFQESMPVEGTDNTIAGAGSCDWTYTLNIDGLEGTMEVSGELFDSVKSTLSITGGTNVFVGAEGQVELIPSPTGNIDIFTGVDYYNVSAVVYIEECDPTYWTWWKNHRGYWDWDAWGGHGGGHYGGH